MAAMSLVRSELKVHIRQFFMRRVAPRGPFEEKEDMEKLCDVDRSKKDFLESDHVDLRFLTASESWS